jgi:selenocysteine lyase/cysteine desulfurase
MGQDRDIWTSVREEFPVASRYIYFNHAAISPLSTRAQRALDALSDLLARNGVLAEDEIMGMVSRIRANAAKLIGAAPDEIAFVKNTTQGVLIAAGAIRWREGDNVVMPAIEFPANVYPWMGLQKLGVELRLVEPEDGAVTADMLTDVCDRRTRAVTVSQVQFSTGYRIDLDELGGFCRDRGIYLHVDAIQALGAMTIDVERYGIDFLSAGGHKWMLALPGVGLFYCRKGLYDELDIPNPGWTGVEDSRNFLDYRFVYRNEAARFEEGSLNLHGITALGVSIERLLEIGPARVEERILHLTGLLAAGLVDRGFSVTSSLEDGERSGILCFEHPARDSESIFTRLREAGVICSLREGAVRLSPHMYNTEEECGRLLALLEQAR